MPIYYNLSLLNNTDTSIPLRFSQNLNIPFLKKPSNYDVSIVRFIKTATNYKMTMAYNSVSTTRQIDYVSRTSAVGANAVWGITQMIDMLNLTVTNLFGTLSGLTTLPTLTEIPYFVYDETTKLISFVAHKTYYLSSLALPITVSFDSTVLNWLYGMPYYSSNINSTGVPTLYTLLVIDYNNNTINTNYLSMTQQAPSFDNYSQNFQGLAISSNLPIANEYVGSSTSIPIIQDYAPSDKDVTTYYNRLVYNAITPYRQVEMISDSPFYNITMDCYTIAIETDARPDSITYGQAITKYNPMWLQSGGNASIKLMFTEKARNKYA